MQRAANGAYTQYVTAASTAPKLKLVAFRYQLMKIANQIK
ncbi:hypothetical protein YPPY32_4222 [Yersinia pestis PY-32]|uniref:Uncharacterized protein n=1 Tax=Yersinia pestis PY-08 TaxID=992134 RepID=A0AB72ZE64_YERPE|nr:hypothetical protein YPPY08_3968 [Yersinia pestis PY-08]EIR73098.1 hypothetical protein YPPY32_4222 [Yersinia pestis PY-32]EIS37498.1 hypothetical protein YPPY58_3975 [Yersinia pestis PY-58]EIS91205.1 hypothetical protein YPPY89_4178 [Yersinia pestis PY-89]